MSDEIVHTSINIPKSKKRQLIDDILESRVSHLSMSSETGCLDDLDESLTRIEIHQQTETGIFLLFQLCNSGPVLKWLPFFLFSPSMVHSKNYYT